MSAMRQQVNLYQPTGELRAGEHLPFAAGTAALVVGAVCTCLLGVWGFGVWRVERLERALQSLRREQQEQNETMAALGAARAAGVSAEQLDATVKALGLALDVHRRTLELLRGGGAGETIGFSARLSALASRPVPGVWLDHVVLSGFNGEMSVAGSALDPKLVPSFLHGLAAEQALAGVRFDDFVIERPQPAHAQEPSKTDSPPNRHFNFHAASPSLHASGADEHS
jgi:hypothetical protein